MARDHGGNLDAAQARFGTGDWIDLSTGINRRPWPVQPLSDTAFRALPMARAERALIRVAAEWFGCADDHVLPMAGATAACLINRHCANRHWRVTDNPFTGFMDIPASGQVHHSVRAPTG